MKEAIKKISLLLQRLSKVTDVGFVFRFTNNSWLRFLPEEQQEHCCSYCKKIKKSPYRKLKECIYDHREATIRRSLELRVPFTMICHAGIKEGVVPIFIRDRYFGAIFIGPFAADPETRYFKAAKEYKQIPTFDQRKTEALLGMVNDMVGVLIPDVFEDQNDFQILPELKVEDDRIFKGAIYMKINFRKRLTAGQTARHCQLSLSRFLHLFKEETGFSFSDYLQRLRVYEARRLLEVTNLSIGEIATESGVVSQSRLGTLFRRYYGKMPKECRLSPRIRLC
jgi:AraC-like DNA-binding protein